MTHKTAGSIFGALLMSLAIAPSSAAAQQNPDLAAGRATFDSICAACHGTTGRPDPQSPVVKAFTPPPADLSDPLFNSREPASDWEIVVKHGGPSLGLSEQMPAQGEVLSDAEVSNVVGYAKTLADTSAYPPGELNFFLPISTKKAFPEDEVVWKSRLSDQPGHNVWYNALEFEKRFGKRSMGVLEIVHKDDGETSEITAVEIGVKSALHWSLENLSILSGAVILAVPTTGDESEALLPYLAYGKQLSDKYTFQGSVRAASPFDDLDDGAIDFRGIVHYLWSPWPRSVFPALEATAVVPFDSDDGDSVKWTLLPQIRIGLTRGGHVAMNLGVEFPLSDQSWNTRYHLTLLWDFADGSFFKGW